LIASQPTKAVLHWLIAALLRRKHDRKPRRFPAHHRPGPHGGCGLVAGRRLISGLTAAQLGGCARRSLAERVRGSSSRRSSSLCDPVIRLGERGSSQIPVACGRVLLLSVPALRKVNMSGATSCGSLETGTRLNPSSHRFRARTTKARSSGAESRTAAGCSGCRDTALLQRRGHVGSGQGHAGIGVVVGGALQRVKVRWPVAPRRLRAGGSRADGSTGLWAQRALTLSVVPSARRRPPGAKSPPADDREVTYNIPCSRRDLASATPRRHTAIGLLALGLRLGPRRSPGPVRCSPAHRWGLHRCWGANQC
jgi:hypothetical protein